MGKNKGTSVPQKEFTAVDAASTASFASWLVPLAFLGIAVAIQQLQEAGSLNKFLGGEPSPKKPFATFEEFYPYYLEQHSDQQTKRMHFVGTGIFIAVCGQRSGHLRSEPIFFACS
jgi:hypothetical protein